MKKVIIILALTLLVFGRVFAQNEHGHHNGNAEGGSNPSNTSTNTGNKNEKKSPGNLKNKNNSIGKKNPPNQKIGKTSSGFPQNNNSNHDNLGTGTSQNSHHFNRPVQSNKNNQGENKNTNDFEKNNPSKNKAGGHQKFNGLSNDNANNGKKNQEHVSSNLKKIGVKHLPGPIQDKNKILHTDPSHSKIDHPQNGPDGKPLHVSDIKPKGKNAGVVQIHMKHIVNNTNITNQINIYNNQETTVNHYYWHTSNGTNYCHYYDSAGYHWYGWYWGGSCFWTRWYAGNWWWYDSGYGRWCYWYDDCWWWQDPYHVNVVYVYNNDQYVPANSEEKTETLNPSTEVSFSSSDGTRMVKILDGDAFLYDAVEGETGNKPVYLASNVKEVKFSNPQNGKGMQIMLILNDGSFELYDSDGNPYNNQSDN